MTVEGILVAAFGLLWLQEAVRGQMAEIRHRREMAALLDRVQAGTLRDYVLNRPLAEGADRHVEVDLSRSAQSPEVLTEVPAPDLAGARSAYSALMGKGET